MQTCSPRFGRPGTGRAAAGLHFGLRASVSAPQYGNRAPVRPSTPQVGWYTFPTILEHIYRIAKSFFLPIGRSIGDPNRDFWRKIGIGIGFSAQNEARSKVASARVAVM